MPEVNDPLPNGFWRFQPHHSHHEFGNWNYAVLFLINVCCHVNSVLYKLKHLSTSQLHLLLRRKLKQWKKLVCAPGNWHFTSTSPYYIANKEGQPFRSRQTRAILAWHEQYTWSAMIQRAGTRWQACQESTYQAPLFHPGRTVPIPHVPIWTSLGKALNPDFPNEFLFQFM